MINQRTLILFFWLVIISFGAGTAVAQQQTLKGKILNKDKQPLEFVEAILLKNDTIYVEGVATDSLGYFSFRANKGSYRLILEYLGEENFNEVVNLNQDLDLGEIIIDDSELLEDLIISVDKKLIERKVDRLIFNAQNSIAAKGLTLIELLQNTPMVKVEDTALSIIGKNSVSVMINNRMIDLTGTELMSYLRSLSSDEIETIEIITTPPAKYDAEGNSGIINIIQKKTHNNGISGNIGISYLQRTWASYIGNTRINFENTRISSSLIISPYAIAYKAQEDFEITGSVGSIEEYLERKNFNKGASITSNTTFKLSPQTNIGFIYTYSNGKSNMNQYGQYFSFNSNDNNYKLETESKRRTSFNYNTLSAFLETKIDTLGRKLEIIFNTISNTNKNPLFIETINDVPNVNDIETISSKKYRVITGQFDFILPYKWLNLESGGKYSYLNEDADFRYFEITNNTKNEDFNKSNYFEFIEQTASFYISGYKKLNEKITAKIGLRYEHTSVNGISLTIGEKNEYSYSKVFPSAYLLYQFDDNNQFNISYSKRIGRPNMGWLNPFRKYNNSKSYLQGNPYLLPSFSNNVELNYSFKNRLSFTMYYSFVTDKSGVIEFIDDQGNQISNFVNAFKENTYGASVYYISNNFNWWQTTLSSNIWYKDVASNNKNLIAHDGFGGHFAINNNIYFDSEKNILFQLNYQHYFPQSSNNTYIYNYANLNSRISFFLLEKNLSIYLNVNDVFKQNIIRTTLSQDLFNKNTYSYQDTRNFSIGVSYNFGKKKIKGGNKNIQFEESNR